jgi:hypothetical protein
MIYDGPVDYVCMMLAETSRQEVIWSVGVRVSYKYQQQVEPASKHACGAAAGNR